MLDITAKARSDKKTNKMAKFAQIFVFALCVYVISAIPVENQAAEEPQVDLLSLESVSLQDAVASAVNEDLTRDKRQHHHHHHGHGNFKR